MNQIELKISMLDSFKADFKGTYLILAATILFLSFYGNYSVSSMVTGGLICIAVVLFVSLVMEPKITYLTLTPDSFAFKTRALKTLSYGWRQPVSISTGKVGKYRCNIIAIPGTNQKVHVPAVIFSYPEVKEFITKYAPSDHGIYALVSGNP